ncbi:hypothetical protein [Streptomyces sp. NPDC059816]|uniref:hypothetical protein n=1 Tax=Streptomyces sp. NPDC059816 TaxID=3346960 RepID=UPI0036651EA0
MSADFGRCPGPCGKGWIRRLLVRSARTVTGPVCGGEPVGRGAAPAARAVEPRGPEPAVATGDLWEVRPDDWAAARAACRRLPDRQPLNPALVTDLTGRAQSARAWRVTAKDDDGTTSARAALDASHLLALRRIVQVHGWPGYRLVGSEGSLAALELALLCGTGPFLRRLLRLIEVPLRTGDVAPLFRTLLHDRACVLDGQRQWSGTQQHAGAARRGALWPVEEPDLVDLRRGAAGLRPLPRLTPTPAELTPF